MKDYWASEASSILKSILGREGVTYKELARRLTAIGFEEEEATLRNKVNRGTFQFQFFLRCLVVLGYRDVMFEVRSEAIERP